MEFIWELGGCHIVNSDGTDICLPGAAQQCCTGSCPVHRHPMGL